mmetsp:Transcript_41448/g.81980  ORF Transcript_41448/g.81980 Transcript_41448/m.81980 type:complete len:213 (+) Transcript_41448:710-1348(+)
MLVHVSCSRTPTHAKVNNVHAFRQFQFAHDEIELVCLRLIKVIGTTPVCTGVGHRWSQHCLIQIVASIVMLLCHPGRPVASLHVKEISSHIGGQRDESHHKTEVVLAFFAAGPDGGPIEKCNEKSEGVHLDLPMHVTLCNPQIALEDHVRPCRLVNNIDDVEDRLGNATGLHHLVHCSLCILRLLEQQLQRTQSHSNKRNKYCANPNAAHSL